MTETTKWSDPWFRKLPENLKLLWLWLLDNCDCAGIIEPDIDLASFQIGASKELPRVNDIPDLFDGRIQLIGKSLFIRKFVSYQYGETLNPVNKAHLGVIKRLQLQGIDCPVKIQTNDLIQGKNKAPSKGHTRGLQAPQVQEQEQDKEKDKDKEKETFLIPENATEKDALIKGSANKNKKARFNTPLMIRVGSWFGRREDTIWTNQETQALIDASPTPAQIDGMERFYMAEETNPPTLHHKHSLITMLNQWNTELDKARKYATDQAKRNQ